MQSFRFRACNRRRVGIPFKRLPLKCAAKWVLLLLLSLLCDGPTSADLAYVQQPEATFHYDQPAARCFYMHTLLLCRCEVFCCIAWSVMGYAEWHPVHATRCRYLLIHMDGCVHRGFLSHAHGQKVHTRFKCVRLVAQNCTHDTEAGLIRSQRLLAASTPLDCFVGQRIGAVSLGSWVQVQKIQSVTAA